jgi:ubiquinone/menaquinone biosynthesis C-methylase UbiE
MSLSIRNALLFTLKNIFGKIFSVNQISKQLSQPKGFWGRYLIGNMLFDGNMPHIKHLLSQHTFTGNEHLLDIGFGPGQTFTLLAKNRSCKKLYGIEISKAMLDYCTKRYKSLIKTGQLDLKYGSVDTIPHPDKHFDIVVTSNTLYFWPDTQKSIKEIFRVL